MVKLQALDRPLAGSMDLVLFAPAFSIDAICVRPGLTETLYELIRTALGGIDGQDAVVEVLEIGEPVRRGHSRLGPVVVVPSRGRHRNGKIYEEKRIIRFRFGEGAASWVVYSGSGVPYQLE
jgi:hypothetical protein